MAVIRVLRNRHYMQPDQYMYNTIQTVWTNPNVVKKFVYGTTGTTADDIYRSFEMTHKSLCRMLRVKVHVFQLQFDFLKNMSEVEAIVHKIMEYLKDYQQIVTINNTDGIFQATFVINSISARTRQCFHDNNTTYIQLINYLSTISISMWDLQVAEGTIFEAHEKNTKAYKN